MARTNEDRVFPIIAARARRNRPVTEAILAKALGVSRAPVREALQHLEEIGLIVRRQNRGIRLVPITPRQVRHIYDMRMMLEGLACRYLAEKPGARTIDKLRRILADPVWLQEGEALEKKRIALDMQMHKAIISGCGSRLLINLCRQLHITTISVDVSFFMFPQNTREIRNIFENERANTRREHGLIVDALASGNPDEAEKAARSHLSGALKRTLKYFES